MDLHVLSIEYSLSKPDPLLGDAQMSPLFHRVSSQCPVLHLFGHTHTSLNAAEPSQRTACVHVHGVYPSFMVPQYDKRVSAMQFGAQLEVVAVAAFGLRPNAASETPQIVHDVQIVHLVPFYGYHEKARPFFRVRIVDPSMTGKLVELLNNTRRVGGRRWQSYESHAPFHAQFMSSYGIAGMSPFRLSSCKARTPIPNELKSFSAQKRLLIETVLPRGEPPRLTCVEIEVDISAASLRGCGSAVEPGENLLSVRRMVRQYFTENGIDDALRRAATLDSFDRHTNVAQLQEDNPLYMSMREKARMYLNARIDSNSNNQTKRASGLHEEQLSHDSYVPPSFSMGGDEGLTPKLLEDMRRGPMHHAALTTDSSSPCKGTIDESKRGNSTEDETEEEMEEMEDMKKIVEVKECNDMEVSARTVYSSEEEVEVVEEEKASRAEEAAPSVTVITPQERSKSMDLFSSSLFDEANVHSDPAAGVANDAEELLASSSEPSQVTPTKSASVECVEAPYARLRHECRQDGFAIRSSSITGDMRRNFRCVIDESHHCIVVSAASWPYSVPLDVSTNAPQVNKKGRRSSNKYNFTTTTTTTTAAPTTTGISKGITEHHSFGVDIVDDNLREKGDEKRMLASLPLPFLSHVAPSPLTAPPVNPNERTRRPRVSGSVTSAVHVTCTLRVLCVEVLVSEGMLMAVGLGRTNVDNEAMGVRLFCVALPGFPEGQHSFTGTTEIFIFPTEALLLRHVRNEICAFDPDLILSWEGIKYGLGLLAQRYKVVLKRNLAKDISRFTRVWPRNERKNDNENLDRCGDVDANANAEDKEKEEEGEFGGVYDTATDSDVVADEDSDGGTESTHDNASIAENTYVKDNVNKRRNHHDHIHEHSNSNSNSHSTTTVNPAPNDGTFVRRLTHRFSGSGLRISGRIVLSLGRQLRKSLSLSSHTVQMVYHHLFGESLPYFSDASLAAMCMDANTRWVALSTLLSAVIAPHRVARHVNFYTRTSESARMFGILFYEALSRGSQYRVEGTLHRMTQPMGYAMLSPSLAQVHRQPRLQSMPLVMQPRSGFYREDPVVVLDFRSLYPSVVIAYNICYSTCLGVVSARRRGRLGVIPSYKQCDSVLCELLSKDSCKNGKHRITFTPNGCMFTTPDTREGILPRMLQAILDARFELQSALRHVAKPLGDEYMQRILHQQQMAIKLLANTTYGYTAASFSGRMPCREVADAIVLLGRQTLERAIRHINSHPSWAAEVLYGDTDSLFVRLPGRTRTEAFGIGEDMAREITAANPSPVTLQFERVLQPCMLLTKKRYVGYAYTRPEQEVPDFYAKGIETVRRDQCPATARLTRSLLHQLFSGATESVMRSHFFTEVGKLQRGDCNPADCIFRRAVRLGRYRSDSTLPAGARLALRRMETDWMHTPYWGERLPYVVVHSADSVQLRDQVVHPQQLLRSEDDLRIHAEYYIKKHIIPTLDRMLCHVGFSAAQWYATMPRRRTYVQNVHFSFRPTHCTSKRGREDHAIVDVDAEEITTEPRPIRQRGVTLDAYYQRALCLICGAECRPVALSTPPMCVNCMRNRAGCLMRVTGRRWHVERRLRHVEKACVRCVGSCGAAGGPRYVAGVDIEDIHIALPRHLIDNCISIDCDLSFEKKRLTSMYEQLMALEQFIKNLSA